MPRKVYAFAMALILLASLAATYEPAKAVTVLPPGFTTESVVAGLTGSTTIAFAPDGRMFIGQKNGRVRVAQNGVLLPTDFIDLSAEVNDYWDRGLLGIAIHPDFPQTPYVYLIYVYDPPGTTNNGSGARVSRLVRVTADPNNTNVALPGSEVVLLGTNSTFANIGDPNSNNGPASCLSGAVYVQDCIAADSPSHAIGMLIFGTDGSLFVSSGDGAHFFSADPRALRALDLDSLNGKLLRINPITGQGYADNPFYDGDLNSNRSKVYDLGLRNPFRVTIDVNTNIPFIGDVGFNSWEEIDTGRGENFGWPCYEGDDTGSAQQGSYKNSASTSATCAALYAQGLGAVEAPIYAYDHSLGGASIQAGSFYRGSAYPAQYKDALFISDYNRDTINYLTFDAFGNATEHSFGTDVSPVGGIVQMIAGPDTNLYYVAYNGPIPNTSEIRRIRYTAGGNTPPTANASANPTSGYIPLTVNFSSQGSYDPDAQPLTYLWDFGDGNTSTSANPTHTYTTINNFTVTLTVTDTQNASGSDTVNITIGNLAPVATILTPADGATYNTGDTINFSGTGVDNEEGNLTGASLQWNVLLHHNQHVHFDFVPGLTGTSGSFVVPDHGDDSWIELCLNATDSGGLTDQKCVALNPNTIQVTFNTVPSGLKLEYDGVEYTTSFNAVTIVNSVRDLIAPLQQTLPNNQGCYSFVSWSDGGAATHSVTIPATDQTYTATYGPCTPAITTTLHDESHSTLTSAALGDIIHDSAEVSGAGATPTGTVTFKVFSNLTCSGDATDAGTVTLDGSGIADPSDSATVAEGGLSYQATYNGDSNYVAQTGVCEPLYVQPEFTSDDHTTFTVGDPGSFDITTKGTPTVSSITMIGALPNGVTFTDNGNGTAKLEGTPTTGTNGVYNLTFTAVNGIVPDAVQAFTLTVNQAPPPTISSIDGINTAESTPDNILSEFETVSVNVTEFTVTFSEDVLNVGSGDSDYARSVINPDNYMLVRDNGNGFETTDCETGVAGDDTAITIDAVAYDNNGGTGPFVATLSVNGGLPLSNGTYRLYACGTTSIYNLFGIPLAGNGNPETDFVRNFFVLFPGGGGGGQGGGGGNNRGRNNLTLSNGLIPLTGFAPGRVTSLPVQPESSQYQTFPNIRLEIPSLGLNMPIVGIQQTASGWDLTWLNNNAGYLDGTAFPTWVGNTVLTAHVLDATNAPGPFANLKDLKNGDLVYIHAFGLTYVYRVETSAAIAPTDTAAVFNHEDYNWLTLVTCENYVTSQEKYASRRVVKAVLISVIPKK